jgi:hypothetical protein
VIAPAQFYGVTTHLSEHTPAFGTLGFGYLPRRHGITCGQPTRQRVCEQRTTFRVPLQRVLAESFGSFEASCLPVLLIVTDYQVRVLLQRWR